MPDADATRKRVADTYTKAVTGPGGCCGPGDECGPVASKGVAVQTAGYDRSQLAALPDDAVTNSFGCGDPVAFAGIRPGDVVLDLGSGAGIDLLLAAQKTGPEGRVIGVDMTDEMVERARSNIAEAGAGNVEVRKGIIEDLPVDSSSVDWVISNCVINLSPEKPRVFAELARVLRPGGRISVSDIVVERLPRSVRRSKALYDSCVAGAISEADYAAGLQAVGLTDVRAESRLTYESSQIAAIAESEMGGRSTWWARLKANLAARYLKGRISSVRFVATKPG